MQSRALQTPKVERAIRAQATAVRIVAVLMLLATILVVGQALVRQASAEAHDDRVSALARHRAQRSCASSCVARGLVIGVAAALVAVAVAILMSPLMPVGLARIADLHRGFDVDPLILGLGALADRGRRSSPCASSRRGTCRRATTSRRRPPPTAGATAAGGQSAVAERRHGGAVRARARAAGERSTGDVDDRARRDGDHRAAQPGCGRSRRACSTCSTRRVCYGWNWSVKSGAPALPDVSRGTRARVLARSGGRRRSLRAARSPRPSSGSSGST